MFPFALDVLPPVFLRLDLRGCCWFSITPPFGVTCDPVLPVQLVCWGGPAPGWLFPLPPPLGQLPGAVPSHRRHRAVKHFPTQENCFVILPRPLILTGASVPGSLGSAITGRKRGHALSLQSTELLRFPFSSISQPLPSPHKEGEHENDLITCSPFAVTSR